MSHVDMFAEENNGFPSGIAGHAATLAGHNVIEYEEEEIQKLAQDWLGLTDEMASYIFGGKMLAYGGEVELERIYVMDVVSHLYHFKSFWQNPKPTYNKNILNKAMIYRVADVVEAKEHKPYQIEGEVFNMAIYENCGSPRCIAGWAVYMEKPHLLKGCETHEAAAEILGFDHDLSHYIFNGMFSWKNINDITQKEAASVLRSLVE